MHGMPDDNLDSLKIPPHSVDAEQAVLGRLLLENKAFDSIVDILRNEADFYRYEHKLIYAHFLKLHMHGRAADIVTVAESLDNSQKLDDVGGLAYLVALVENTPTAANICSYAEIVHERAVMRQLIATGSSIAESAYQPNGRSSQQLIDDAEAKIFQLSTEGRAEQDFKKIEELLPQLAERLETLAKNDDGITGIATGFTDLDEKTSGLQAGDLIIVAGRPSMGKTAFALNIAEHVAVVEKLPVAIFSMEMSGLQLTLRLIGSLGRIDQQNLRNGRLAEDDWRQFSKTAGKLFVAPLYIDEGSSLTSFDVRARARRLHRQCGALGMIIIDYLQLMSAAGRHRSENRATEISEITRSLKALAKELKVPVLALSQLNRAVDSRNDRRPTMSDLRESGAIEQDADLILFLYRDEMYNKETPENKGKAEVDIGKQRNGPTGRIDLTFLGQYTRFENYSDNHAGSL